MAPLTQEKKLEYAMASFFGSSWDDRGTCQITPVMDLKHISKGQSLVVVLEGDDECATILENIDIANRTRKTLLLTPDRILTAAYHDYGNFDERVFIGTFPEGFRVQYELRRLYLKEKKVFVYDNKS